MKAMRKLLVSLLGLILMITLTGCGTNNENADAKSGDVELRISWWGGDNRHEATIAAVRAFEAANPGIVVNVEPSGWDGAIENITTQLAGGTEPDIMQVNYDWLLNFTPDGTGFYDLRELDHIIDLNGWDPAFLEFGEMNGVLNAIPVSANASIIAVNRNIYEKFGADIPETWDDFFEAAEKFDEGYYPLVPEPGANRWTLISTYIGQMTGLPMLNENGEMNFTIEDIKEGLLWYQSLVDAEVIPDRATVLEAGGNEYFDGKHAGVMLWVGALEETARNLADADGGELVLLPSFPEIDGAKSSGVYVKPSMLFAISKNSKHPEEAAKLLDFLLNDPEGVRLMGTNRGVPANTNAAEILEENEEFMEITADAYAFTSNVDGISQGPMFEMGEIVTIYDDILEKFNFGQLSAEETAEQLYNELGAGAAKIVNQ